MNAWFLIFAAVTLAGACAAMTLRGLVHCALSLAVAFAGFGVMYLYLGAQFLGLAQLLVYVGAIAVLIVFVVLLTRGGDRDASAPADGSLPAGGILVAAAVLAVFVWASLHSSALRSPRPPAPQHDTRQLGAALMNGYVLPLEVIGLMLTAALVGAAIVAMKEKQDTQ